MNSIIEWIEENKDIIDEVKITIEDRRKSFDFRQFLFDFVIISMVSLTIKAIIALNCGHTYINLY